MFVLIGVVGLVLEAVGLYILIMGQVSRRFDNYVLKEAQQPVNLQFQQDIADVKRGMEKISDKIDKLLQDVPGIITRVIREER